MAKKNNSHGPVSTTCIVSTVQGSSDGWYPIHTQTVSTTVSQSVQSVLYGSDTYLLEPPVRRKYVSESRMYVYYTVIKHAYIPVHHNNIYRQSVPGTRVVHANVCMYVCTYKRIQSVRIHSVVLLCTFP